MRTYLFTVFLLIFLAVSTWAQEEESTAEVAPVAEVTTDEEAPVNADLAAAADEVNADDEILAEEEIDDSDLDIQDYEEDDDDFVPTEEIPADEPIPFPSNI